MTTIKLNTLSKWQELEPGQSLALRGSSRRSITLHVNTEDETSFVALEHGVEYFLGVVMGQGKIEFSVDGDVEVSATGEGVVWFWTDDGLITSRKAPEARRLFVKPMTREQRSPAMDALAAKIQARADHRFAQQEANNERLRGQLLRERNEREAERAAAQELVDAAARAGEQEPGGAGSSEGS